MLDHPDFDRLEAEWGPRFDESPWSPELLDTPEPSTITGKIDHLRRKLSSAHDTVLMEVISGPAQEDSAAVPAGT